MSSYAVMLSYGYNKLTICLKEDYKLLINRKKVYRLCKELNILRPQRKIHKKHPRRLAKQDTITDQISFGRWM